MEAFWDSRDGISMTHPHLGILFKTFKEWIFVIKRLKIGTAVFAATSWLYLASVELRHVLSTIADAKDGILATDFAQVHLEGFRVIHAIG